MNCTLVPFCWPKTRRILAEGFHLFTGLGNHGFTISSDSSGRKVLRHWNLHPLLQVQGEGGEQSTFLTRYWDLACRLAKVDHFKRSQWLKDPSPQETHERLTGSVIFFWSMTTAAGTKERRFGGGGGEGDFSTTLVMGLRCIPIPPYSNAPNGCTGGEHVYRKKRQCQGLGLRASLSL